MGKKKKKYRFYKQSSKENRKMTIGFGAIANQSQVPSMGFAAVHKPMITKPENKILPETLRWSKRAWNKLQHLCQHCPGEIGGFAVTDPENPFYVLDFNIVKQKSSPAYSILDPEAVANYIEDELVAQRPVRIWVHTHPSSSAQPSLVDEEQLSTNFANTDYFIMFIMAREGQLYCRYRLQPPGMNVYIDKELRVTVDTTFFENDVLDVASWMEDYKNLVELPPPPTPITTYGSNYNYSGYGKASKMTKNKDELGDIAKALLASWEANEVELYQKNFKDLYVTLGFTDQFTCDQILREISQGRYKEFAMNGIDPVYGGNGGQALYGED